VENAVCPTDLVDRNEEVGDHDAEARGCVDRRDDLS
jgi:hypothetical protein